MEQKKILMLLMFLLITLEAFSQSNNAEIFYNYGRVEKTGGQKEIKEVKVIWEKSYWNFKVTQGDRLSYFILVPARIEISSGDFWEIITFKCMPQNNGQGNQNFTILVENKAVKGFVSISINTIEYNVQIVYE